MTPQLDTEESLQALKQAILESMQNPVHASQPGLKVLDQHGRPIETGRVIPLRVHKEDFEKAKTVIKAQWQLLQVAALSGAAEAPDELDPRYHFPPLLQDILRTDEDIEVEEEPAKTPRPTN